MAAAKVLVATATFAAEVEGREVFVHAGERFAANHPIAKACADLFEPEASAGLKTSAAPRRQRKRAT